MRRVVVTMRTAEMGTHRERCDAVSHDWLAYLRSFGAAITLVSNGDPAPEGLLDHATALLLTNGNDVGPLPGESASVAPSSDAVRDRTEFGLLDAAVARDIPVLGVCRGLQLINVWGGGRLRRDLQRSHVAITHPVSIVNPLAARVLGCRGMPVNSFHDHGVGSETLSPALIPFAVSPDGLVEGAAHRSARITGIQWHPERPGGTPDLNRRIVEAWLNGLRLVEAC